MVAQDRRYTKEHEWLKQEADRCMVGITDHAQEELGDIVYLEMPEIGTHVQAGDGLVIIESVKAVANVYAPVAGKVVAVNEALEDAPETVNEDAMGTFLVAIVPDDAHAVETLMTAQEYQALLEA